MLDAFSPIQISLGLLLGGTLISYVGTRLLWAGAGFTGLARGVVMGVPIVAMAMAFSALGHNGTAVALLCTASVLMLSLGLGVSAASTEGLGGIASPSLRLLAPIAACTFVVGLAGELTLIHAVCLAVIAGLILWSAPKDPTEKSAGRQSFLLTLAIPITVGGATLVVMAGRIFLTHVSSIVVTPIVVLLVAPAMLLALLGLLAADARSGNGAGCIDSIVGFIVTCLGGQALVIATAHLLARVAPPVTAAATQPAATDPVDVPAVIVMPLATWRIDSVLLLVLALILFPVGTGHFRLGKIEGLFLIGLYLFYASVATHTGAR